MRQARRAEGCRIGFARRSVALPFLCAALLAGPVGVALAASPPKSPRDWPDLGIDHKTPASALEHILDRTIVIINNTSAKLYFSVRLPSEPDWQQFRTSPKNSSGIFCPECAEDSEFRFYMATTKGPIDRELKANFRYMIVAGASGNWDLLQGPALH